MQNGFSPARATQVSGEGLGNPTLHSNKSFLVFFHVTLQCWQENELHFVNFLELFFVDAASVWCTEIGTIPRVAERHKNARSSFKVCWNFGKLLQLFCMDAVCADPDTAPYEAKRTRHEREHITPGKTSTRWLLIHILPCITLYKYRDVNRGRLIVKRLRHIDPNGQGKQTDDCSYIEDLLCNMWASNRLTSGPAGRCAFPRGQFNYYLRLWHG